jgi:subtilisin family serine protease
MRKLKVLGASAAAALALSLVPATPTQAVSSPRSNFIVELAVPPLASYGEGISLYSVLPEAVRSYTSFLAGRQDEVLRRAAATAAPVTYGYRVAFPGFAARLTDSEVARLAADPAVRAVSHDGVSHPTAAPPDEGSGGGGGPLGRDGAAFLGLPGGLWKEAGGPSQAGAGIVIGMLDTGIYPEHPSFADHPKDADGKQLYQGPLFAPPADWRGACQAGEEFAVTDCNNKLIGARYFVDGFGKENLHPDEFLSARDADGHGSHTAATAGGNYGVDPEIGGYDLGVPYISGIAPRAYLAAYKVCWTRKESPDPAPPGQDGPGSCNDSDTVAAIDAAVADGVDVINYSVGTDTAALMGPVERAFLFAADAGVFVANSAGNNGPKPSTVGSPAAVPWVTSVAASSLARQFASTVEVVPASGRGKHVATTGATLSRGVGPAPLVDSVAVPLAGVAADQAELCLPGSLDPGAVKGNVVLCKRGNNPRVEKGKVVADAGGVGMILYNSAADQELAADVHFLPAVQVTLADGQAIKSVLAAGVGATAEIGGARPVAAPADVLAAFSSRGPETPVPDIPKPDLAAPGVNILAANTPTPADAAARKGELFQTISGTSMASPHVAGAAALLLQRDPGRSPAAVKSALMTTARPAVLREDGTTPADAFDAGSGRIDPNLAAEPGLVLDEDMADYARYLEGQDPTLVDGDLPPLAPTDLNLPAVSYGSFTGTATTTRTFTSVDDVPGTWNVAATGVPGLTVAFTPSAFEIAPGASQPVQLTLTLAGAPLDTYTFGALVLTNAADGRTVRLPVSVRPVRIAAPATAAIPTDAAAGSAPVRARAGYQGDLSALGWGLAPPRSFPGETVATAPPDNDHITPSDAVDVFDVTVPPGAQVLAADVANADGGAKETDLDLFLFYDDEGDGFDAGDELATSADADAAESIAIPMPAAGAYRFSVVGFKTRDPLTTYDFRSWLGADPTPDDPTTPSSAPGLEVRGDPRPVIFGQEVALDLTWSGLAGDGVYLGLVTFHDAAAPDPADAKAMTLVRVTKRSSG